MLALVLELVLTFLYCCVGFGFVFLGVVVVGFGVCAIDLAFELQCVCVCVCVFPINEPFLGSYRTMHTLVTQLQRACWLHAYAGMYTHSPRPFTA